MKTNTEAFIFMSVFYQQGKWHSLLSTIQREIFSQPEIRNELTGLIIYLNRHRGSGIRLALKFKKPATGAYKLIEDPIHSFLIGNPSISQSRRFPITGFFTDFPNNEIRYNLFNQRAIMPAGLYSFQILLSNILLIFFEDHPVDDDGVFTLVTYLQIAILDGICTTEEFKREFCLIAMNQMKNNNKLIPADMIDIQPVHLLDEFEGDLMEPGDIDELFEDIEKASRILSMHTGNLLSSYFTILHIIQLQLFRIPAEVFFDSLDHLRMSHQYEMAGDN